VVVSSPRRSVSATRSIRPLTKTSIVVGQQPALRSRPVRRV
jgi:hypothetical protein